MMIVGVCLKITLRCYYVITVHSVVDRRVIDTWPSSRRAIKKMIDNYYIYARGEKQKWIRPRCNCIETNGYQMDFVDI